MKFFLWYVVLATTTAVFGQPFKLQGAEDFLVLVDPLITEHEREMYRSIKEFSQRDYFEAVFWIKRDPHPELPGNSFKRAYFERRDQARRFDEGSTPGTKSARGRIFLLLGEPDSVDQQRLEAGGVVRGHEEIWTYEDPDFEFRFVLDVSGRAYRLDAPAGLAERLEKHRLSQILDRAESYRLVPMRMTIPNIGPSKDIENLTADDRFEIDFVVTYDFFKGDLNKTQVMVGLTFFDASARGLEVNLTAFDPYENKAIDFKRRLEPRNGSYENFFVVLEPDQYDMVMRVTDKDGRIGVQRQRLDVPRLGFAGSSSSILLAEALKPIPLEGFFQSRLFVFHQDYLPVRNTFRDWRGDRLYLLQVIYGSGALEPLEFQVDGQPVVARLESRIQQDDGVKLVHSIQIPAHIRRPNMVQVFRGEPEGSRQITTAILRTKPSAVTQPEADSNPRFNWLLPLSDDVASLNAVAIQPQRSDAQRMVVYLNGVPLAETYGPSWRLELDASRISISGEHTLEVELRDGLGISRASKVMRPLRADEQIKTRAVQITFNLFNRDLEFVDDFDLSQLRVDVDGEPQKPLDVFKLDEPITYCFLVDNSYSMRESFVGNIKAVKQMLNEIRPQDQGFFIAFSDNYYQYNRPSNSKGILNAVADSIQLQRPNPSDSDNIYEENSTFLYEAVAAATHALLQYPGRKVMVLVSDGIGIDGSIPMNGMLNYARENEVVIYTLWVDNNPQLSSDETEFITTEMGKGERFARAIGLTRFFADKDSRRNIIGSKIRNASIHEGMLKMVAEESGGFHYRVFKTDRSLIQAYVRDIEKAIQTQFGMILSLPISDKMQHVDVYSVSDDVSVRTKSEVKVRKTNPLGD